MIANYKNVIRNWLRRSCPVNWSNNSSKAGNALLNDLWLNHNYHCYTL